MPDRFDTESIDAARPHVQGRNTTAPLLRRSRWALAAAVAFGLAAIIAWIVWRDGQAEQVSYQTEPVERGSVEDTVTAIGTLQPYGFVDVGTQVSGQLGKLHVDVGDRVSEGTLLAEIVATIFQARVDANRAQLLAQRAQLADRQAQLILARQQFGRQERLLHEKATSQDAHQSAAAALGSASAQVEVLKAQIQNTESTLKADMANLGYTKIYSPMSGTVVSLTAKQGQTLNANQQAPIILRIADLSTMTVTTQVSEADIGRLTIGMDAYFTTLGLGSKRWRGTLRKILPTPEVVNNVVLYNALFDAPNPTGELMTQMTAQVFFVVAAADDTLLIPLAALNQQQGARSARPGDSPRPQATVRNERAGRDAKRTVQVLREDGTIEQRTVRIGVTNRVSAEVVEGLQVGEQVVVGVRRAGSSDPSSRSGRPLRLS